MDKEYKKPHTPLRKEKAFPMAQARCLLPKEQVKEALKISLQTAGRKPGINAALLIAANALHGQTTWDGEDYDPHYIRVAFNSGTQSLDKMAIGILHDVVEDSDWTLDDLLDIGFSERIVGGVDGVTKRPGEFYFDFLERCSVNPDSVDIKLSDLKDNTSVSRNTGFLNELQQKKQCVYIVSYQYLVALKKGEITPGSSVKDFMLNNSNFRDHMDLYAAFSKPPSVSMKPDINPALETAHGPA